MEVVRKDEIETRKYKEAEKLIEVLQTCNAVYYGVSPFVSKKGHSTHKRWRIRILKRIRKLMGKEKQKPAKSVWDKLKKRSNRI